MSFDATPFAARRARLLASLQQAGGGVAIIPTAPEVMRNRDADYPYRHDSYFYYLTGFTEPEAVLVLVAGKENRSILFCRDKNLEREIWDGYRHGPQAAQQLFALDAAHPIEELDKNMPALLSDARAVYYALGQDEKRDAQLQRWLQGVRALARSGVSAPGAVVDVSVLLDDMRLFKDAFEIDLMKRAGIISAEAHCRAMRICRPGLREYHLEAELLHEFRRNGSQYPAYGSIVATGANSCVLHYRAGDAEIKDGDLVLIDAGCELDSYASDITRTFPANGKFSGPQKALYEIVLAAQVAAIAETAPGKRFMDGHDAAVRVLAQGMLDTGLLDKSKVGSLDDVIEKGDFRQFYMHRTGHWLGMDVHDVGDYRDPATADGNKPWRTLQPGMVLTIEPGIYVRPGEGVPEQFWNIGIRIEDDAHVTPSGCELLTTDVPSKVEDIEALMRQG
ncbi:aminopeptidase P N-terminal domain-containing protein [Herbaspirillum rubrisubalbicans]|uniref:Xaa-Pro aminopeptidase n=1 Tax=Herbaspirillum rubrisubalbicans Os34 TaxID=1235827 RepID=A0A6M3ZLH4_9BURK|nr:aminopeptidase P N-terminal domain-containing protein [Herbaspirillum rubrisubalbicans]NQE48847.1 Xaa-Pro aminopeptidase [Herbaspirillum rubrisubalbicans]QJP99350.1 Xaa-Pro aminopeptidase [Herbaspirillum rubrisubalbicans Os34]